MKIPKKITGYGYIYPVIQQKNLKDKYGGWEGLIHYKKGVIKLEKDLPIRNKEANLLHEVVHLVNREEGLKLKEKTVEKLAKGLYQVLKDSKLLKE